MAEVIIKELQQIKKEYGRPRRTSVENAAEAVYEEKKSKRWKLCSLWTVLVMCVLWTRGFNERNKETADSEHKYVFSCMNTDKICLFTDSGRMHLVKVLDLPYGKLRDKGTPVDNVSNYDSSTEQIVFVGAQSALKEAKICFMTAQG